VELSPAEISKIAGQHVTEMGTLHGFTGYFVRSGAHFQVFYATPDGQQLIPGILYDAAGKDVTRQQVANIPGAVPTVEVTDGKGSPSVSALPLVQKMAFGVVGKDSAPRIYMLIDPQCIYSIRALQMLKPFVDAGRVQLAVVPLSVLDYEDNGASTQAALALLTKPADQIVSAWQARDVDGPASPDAKIRLQVNMDISQAIGVKGTPTLVWRKADGAEGRIDGLPTNLADLLASVGS
jgi:thiol:disulfide interchange protein DsbG